MAMEADDDRHALEEEEELNSISESDADDSDDNDCVYPSECGGDRGGGSGTMSDLRQHLAAVLVAIIAAVFAHTHVHGGGLDAWMEELARDWTAVRSRLTNGGAALNEEGKVALATTTAPYYASAPSMDAIPVSKRRRALELALGAAGDREKGGPLSGGGHEKARSYRRTRGLSFCPDNDNGSSSAADAAGSFSSGNLEEMEFILPLDPSVRVLHSYYLADALGSDSGMVHDEAGDLGTYSSDAILNEIDRLSDANDGEGLMIDQVRSIVRSRLPEPLVDSQHVCLLHQYSLNRSSGRSLRGTTKAYDRPHVSTFYRNRTGKKVAPASLTFTGHAIKFVNLSPDPLDLYWDGGRIPSGPKAGEMRLVLVGTVPSMESVGTASHPGHSFYLAPTYDKGHQLQRWVITEDEPVLYYDPELGDLSSAEQSAETERLTRSGKWTERRRFEREAWIVDRSFGRDYLVKTRRAWLSNFPQPYLNVDGGLYDRNEMSEREVGREIAPSSFDGNKIAKTSVQNGHRLHMWPSDYIGQTHPLETSSLYYTTLPETLERLTERDYLLETVEKRRLKTRKYRSNSPKGKKLGDDNEANVMSLAVKVVSVAPRVLEVKKFLSSSEVQHLIGLAAGVKGDVAMGRSTVSATSVKSDKNVRGTTKNVADARSSIGGWIHREQDEVVDAIFCRIADLLNVDERLMRDELQDRPDGEELPTHDRIVEALQLLRYGPGEEYAAHHDFTYPSIRNRYQPRRYATVLMYLTGEGDVVENGVLRHGDDDAEGDGLHGGETIFPRAITADHHDGVKVVPQLGKAVLFYNVLPDGNMDDLSQHAGGKVESGVKYVANVWVWDPIVN
eukprot:CAMPEP_0172556336 /NCGR_PEP_ID=MMETSP1067-20121228/65600_1 /TAXON_ID=265564 ORGANISM="Thalassiosira punctigera, Strain Tpunct2005C2" /NCGR_SAMPLE_ID=MMETSP1067 /ASSEMBLY_ACC=CAM_ASM_000444 /LENGTH=843 /DNA_ID=CAMNT_0013345125 /DNA_START=75 /DNA_END=2606 /DNA_ORIENTATION=-